MKEDYDKYQIIKKYHELKTKMLKVFEPQCPFKIIRNTENKEVLEDIFKMPYDDIFQFYSDLRYKRTFYAHIS